MHKVLVSDKFSPVGLDVFREAEGIELSYRPGLSAEELEEIIGDFEGLAIRSGTKVTARLLEKATRLKVVGRAGTGVDNVDLDAATERGVCVMNTPGGNTVTTGEHAVAMMLSLARNIPQANASLKSGKWEKSRFQGTELCGKVLGILGLGRVGRIVAERARGLGMRVLTCDPFVTADQARKVGVEKSDLDGILSDSDFISIHVPKNKETQNLIRAENIARMKKGVRIINCSRGGIVNEEDLYEAIVSGHVAGAALDVFSKEPCTENPLFGLDKVIVTPHIGASTVEAQEKVAVAIARQMIAYLADGIAQNAVNVPSVPGELLRALGPFLTLGEKLGSLQAQLSREIPEQITITYGGELNDYPHESVGLAVLKGFCTQISHGDVNFVNARHIAEQRGLKIIEASNKNPSEYTNFLAVTVTYPSGDQRRLKGVKFSDNDIRLTHYNQTVVNIEPEGNMLLITNKAVPGVVGVVGTYLGDAGINIANLRLIHNKDMGTDLTIVTTDEVVPEKTRERLLAHEAILSVRFVRL